MYFPKLLLLLCVMGTSNGMCAQDVGCKSCLQSNCFYCGSVVKMTCVVGQVNCPNGTTVIFSPGAMDLCPSTTTPTPPTTTPPSITTKMSPLLWICFGLVCLLLVVAVSVGLAALWYYKVYPKYGVFCQGQGGNGGTNRPVEAENPPNSPFHEAHLAEAAGRIRATRGTGFENPCYDPEGSDTSDTLYQRCPSVPYTMSTTLGVDERDENLISLD